MAKCVNIFTRELAERKDPTIIIRVDDNEVELRLNKFGKLYNRRTDLLSEL